MFIDCATCARIRPWFQYKQPVTWSYGVKGHLHHNTGKAAQSLLIYETGFCVLLNGTQWRMSRKMKGKELVSSKMAAPEFKPTVTGIL